MLMESSPHQVQDTIPYCKMSLATWNNWVTDRRQAALQRQNLARHTSAKDGSFLGWPTPTTKDQDLLHPSQENRRTVPLHVKVNWPTPLTSDCNGSVTETGLEKSFNGGLKLLAAADWSIETAPEEKEVSKNQQVSLEDHPMLLNFQEKATNSTKTGNGLQARLKPNLNGKQGALLNAAWVDQLMGFPDNWSNVQIDQKD
jgi:hypothetical protein